MSSDAPPFHHLPPSTATAAASPSSVDQGGGGGAASSSISNNSTPRSIAQASPSVSPTLNLTREYTRAVHTASFDEIWTRIHDPSASLCDVQLLHPDQGSIEQALSLARPSKLTRLVTDYFDSSDHTSRLCLDLLVSIDCSRSLYGPIRDLIDDLPSSITQSHCDRAFDTLAEFHRHNNPFPSSDTKFHDMGFRFSQLKNQLNRCLRSARDRDSLVRRSTSCSAICIVGTALGVAISAIVIATHALAALVAAPFLAFLPAGFAKRQLDHISQLDAAAKETYFLHNHLSTVHLLVERLHTTVESDKELVWRGLDCGRYEYPILAVVEHLRKSHPNFLNLLQDLEEHVCICFTAFNRVRTLLLQEIHLNQTRNSSLHYLCLDS